MNKEEIFNEISSCFKMSVDMNGMKKLEEYITNLQQENQKYKEVIDKAINNSQYWIDYYTRLNSDERIALRLQENIDILKGVNND